MSVVHQYNGDPLEFRKYVKSLCTELATVTVKTPVGTTAKMQDTSILHVLLMAKCHALPHLMASPTTFAAFGEQKEAWREANASMLTEAEWETYDDSNKQFKIKSLSDLAHQLVLHKALARTGTKCDHIK